MRLTAFRRVQVTVRVRLFAVMAQEAGRGEVDFHVRDGETVGGLASALQAGNVVKRLPPGVMWAVNQEYTGEGRVLREGDEVAIIPPVSGG